MPPAPVSKASRRARHVVDDSSESSATPPARRTGRARKEVDIKEVDEEEEEEEVVEDNEEDDAEGEDELDADSEEAGYGGKFSARQLCAMGVSKRAVCDKSKQVVKRSLYLAADLRPEVELEEPSPSPPPPRKKQRISPAKLQPPTASTSNSVSSASATPVPKITLKFGINAGSGGPEASSGKKPSIGAHGTRKGGKGKEKKKGKKGVDEGSSLALTHQCSWSEEEPV